MQHSSPFRLVQQLSLFMIVILPQWIQSFATMKALYQFSCITHSLIRPTLGCSLTTLNRFLDKFWQNIRFEAFKIYMWSTIQRSKSIFLENNETIKPRMFLAVRQNNVCNTMKKRGSFIFHKKSEVFNDWLLQLECCGKIFHPREISICLQRAQPRDFECSKTARTLIKT